MILQTKKVALEHPFWKEINKLAKEAFLPEEYVPSAELLKAAERETIDFYVLCDQGKFVGYMAVKLFQDLDYLLFLAIDAPCRSQGYGSRAIEALKAKYPGKKQVVDFEMVDEQAENNAQRKKRRQFYLQNGYQGTGLFISYLGIDYEVFCMDAAFDETVFRDMMQTIRVEGFCPRYFRK